MKLSLENLAPADLLKMQAPSFLKTTPVSTIKDHLVLAQKPIGNDYSEKETLDHAPYISSLVQSSLKAKDEQKQPVDLSIDENLVEQFNEESSSNQDLVNNADPSATLLVESHPGTLATEGAIVAPLEIEPIQDSDFAKRINSLSELGNFKGAINGLILEKLRSQAVVIDYGCADVAIICVESFVSSSNHITLLNTLADTNYQFNVIAEYIADKKLIADVWNFSERRGLLKQYPIINKDNRNIVLYDEIVHKAVSLGTTDIHFEITDQAFSKVRLRIDSRLHDWKSFPTKFLKDSLTAAYSSRNKAGTNSSGSLSFERSANTITENNVAGKDINGRFSGYPLVNGYDVVMRLLDSDPKSIVPTIQDLGYSPYHINDQLLPALQRNAGMIAIAGSTGSGKSTALRSMIYSIPSRDNLKIYSVEDPVEYLCSFMRQISVQRNSDDPDDVVKMKFLSVLRSVLRMDLDVLMLGEIRDHDSASIASELNRTGHRVFTTVHGDSCIDVLARLVSDEIGIHASTLAAKKYLSAVMYQKLLPKLCPHCKLPANKVLSNASQSVLTRRFRMDVSRMFCANEDGCSYCRVEEVRIAGKKGMTVVAEILTPNNEIRNAIKLENWLDVEQFWRSQRQVGFDDPNMAGKTAFEHALYKASIGQIDPQDIEADFESFESYPIFNETV